MSFQAGPIPLADLAQTEAFATRLAPVLCPGDTILFGGDIGAGKTTFARALIRARLGRDEDVPSPTFAIVQIYEAPESDIWHCDLYRLTSPDQALELGLDSAMDTAICLIEWPDRMGSLAPAHALRLDLVAGPDHHSFTISGPDDWLRRLGTVLTDA